MAGAVVTACRRCCEPALTQSPCRPVSRRSKHVPLEKVTDVTFLQGCLARQYGLATIQVQTAGQNGPNGMPELSITGIEDAHNFRKVRGTARCRRLASAARLSCEGQQQVVRWLTVCAPPVACCCRL